MSDHDSPQPPTESTKVPSVSTSRQYLVRAGCPTCRSEMSPHYSRVGQSILRQLGIGERPCDAHWPMPSETVLSDGTWLLLHNRPDFYRKSERP